MNTTLLKLGRNILAIGLAIHACSSAQTCTNPTVVNPGFESGTTSWNVYNATTTTSAPRAGSYCGQLNGNGAGFNQVITVAPNSSYTLTAWLKATSGSSIRLGVKTYGGAEINTPVTSTGWTQVSVNFTTGTSNTSATIYTWQDAGTGSTWADDHVVTCQNTGSNPWTRNASTSSTYLVNNDKVGVGTSSPTAKLQVSGMIKADTIRAISSKPMSTYSDAPIHGYSNPTSGGYACGVSGYSLAGSSVTGYGVGVMGYDNGGSAQLGNIAGFFTSNGGSGNRYGILVDMDGPTPTSYPAGKWAASLHGDVFVEGKLKIKGWTIEAPDYVFEDGYKLLALKDVESFINENKHLPELPSAEEMKNNGLDMTEMNFHLLKKVEELTLYVIRQQKEIDQLKKQATE